MFKKVIIFILFGFAIASCNTKKSEGGSEDQTSEDPAPPEEKFARTLPNTAGCDYRISGVKAGNFELMTLALAQTHLVSASGCQWNLKSRTELHLIGKRQALALAEFKGAVQNPSVVCYDGNTRIQEVSFSPPSALPQRQEDKEAFAGGKVYSATLPKECLVTNLNLTFKSQNQETSKLAVNVGGDIPFKLLNLPFYLFGANETTPHRGNVLNLAKTGNMSDALQKEFFEKFPTSKLTSINHPAKKIRWNYLIVGSRGRRDPYRATKSNDQKDSYDVMAMVMDIVTAIREANGESRMASQHYAPVIMLNKDGEYASLAGGLGGGDRGTGDYTYGGVFFHEQGHASGLPHVGSAYTSGSYPYANGSLHGSAWGWSFAQERFIPPFITQSSSSFARCPNWKIQFDDQGRCIKQDPMQGGSGDQASSDKWTLFSDFNVAQIQGYLEGGRLVKDSNFASGYARWDKSKKEWVEATKGASISGLGGFPDTLNKEQDTIVFTVNFPESFPTIAGTAGAVTGITQIYPPLRYVGNADKLLDAENPRDLASIVPNTGEYPHFCRRRGCDFTLRLTYRDRSVKHYVNQWGYRNWFWDPSNVNQYDNRSLDPNNSNSFRIWALSVPTRGRTLTKVELLDTPRVWTGLPRNPRVLATYP